ncbi:MAG: Xaa-Pro peptidase family protein [Pirellulales bacterium]
MSVFQKRLERLYAEMKRLDIDRFLITSFVNVTYLSGFTGDDSYLLVTDKDATLISDPRYEEQIKEECFDVKVHIRKPTDPILQVAADLVNRKGGSTLAAEPNSLTMGQLSQLQSTVSAKVIASPIEIESFRAIKDSKELKSIRRAIAMAERAFLAMRQRLTAETTERQIANEIDGNIRDLGGKGSAFQTIVGVGPRAALPHGRPSDRVLGESPFVLVDWGANEGLYLSDLTRVLVTGRIPAKFSKIYETVLEAHRKAAVALRPGVLPSEIDGIARGAIEEAGFGKHFNHGLGHGFGLLIHESPRLAKNQVKPLQPGMVVTIEPGIYLPGWGGVRIEDDYLITKEGHERLTSLPQDLEANSVLFL